jgi:RNA polymerase-binding transcription factor
MDESIVRDTLKAERAAAALRIRAITSEFDDIVADSLDANGDDEHDPEGSTIAFERARVVALLQVAQANLDDLDRALARLATGRYSVCEGCGRQISSERLAALPAAGTCIDCAMARRSG